MTINCWSVIEAVSVLKKIMVANLNGLIGMLVMATGSTYFPPLDTYSIFPLFYTKTLSFWSVPNRYLTKAYE
jgi:positive regulator of sigma E activity